MIGRLVALLRWIWRGLVATVLLLVGRRRRRDEHSRRDLPATPRRERLVLVLLLASSLAALAFIAVYAISADTQLLGIAIGAALALLAAASIVASKQLVPQEQESEERPRFALPDHGEANEEDDAAHTARTVSAAGEGITRRRLLLGAGGAAGLALGAAAATPLASLGPGVGNEIFASPWRAGVRLVDENGLPVRAEVLEQGSFLTAFAEGSDPRQFGSPVVVVRVDPARLELPPERSNWAPRGLLAFSKICTHAGCAVNLFRSPLYPAKEPGPALVCPCHYSTFDVLRGGQRIFGPAGRGLPQLPLRIEDSGLLVAAGPMSGQVGPAWSGVRQT